MRATITVLPGDGIGPEVVTQATRVLAAVGERWGHTFSLREALIGGAAIDKTGTALPPETPVKDHAAVLSDVAKVELAAGPFLYK